MTTASARVLVVSHPAVVALNQSIYRELGRYGWDVLLVVPNRWQHEYSNGLFAPPVLEGMEGRVVRRRVVLPGRVQRHAYAGAVGGLIDRFRPDVAFLEQEPFAVAALQWGAALSRRGVPFGVQADENLERPLPAVVKRYRRWVLQRAAFVAARSPRAAELVREWGAAGATPVIPHNLPDWEPVERHGRRDVFTVGFAGRLVEEKGLMSLVAAVGRLTEPARLLLVGDGPQREALREAARAADVDLEIRSDVGHDDMPAAYAQMDVLVLPSLTTETWAEQFGRVLVEALWSGIPIIGSSSGEIPWVVTTTGGGLVFPEGDEDALAAAIATLQDDSERRDALAAAGRSRARELFTLEAVTRELDAALRVAAR